MWEEECVCVCSIKNLFYIKQKKNMLYYYKYCMYVVICTLAYTSHDTMVLASATCSLLLRLLFYFCVLCTNVFLEFNLFIVVRSYPHEGIVDGGWHPCSNVYLWYKFIGGVFDPSCIFFSLQYRY